MEPVFRTEPLDGPVGAVLLAAFAEEISQRYPGWNPSRPSARPDEFVDPAGCFLVGYHEIPDYNANPSAAYWVEKSLV